MTFSTFKNNIGVLQRPDKVKKMLILQYPETERPEVVENEFRAPGFLESHLKAVYIFYYNPEFENIKHWFLDIFGKRDIEREGGSYATNLEFQNRPSNPIS